MKTGKSIWKREGIHYKTVMYKSSKTLVEMLYRWSSFNFSTFFANRLRDIVYPGYSTATLREYPATGEPVLYTVKADNGPFNTDAKRVVFLKCDYALRLHKVQKHIEDEITNLVPAKDYLEPSIISRYK